MQPYLYGVCWLRAGRVTLILLTAAASIQAATITVNLTGDQDNSAAGNKAGICDVNSFLSGNQCTLRAAIQVANLLAGDDTINFNIPTTDPGYSSGVWTINLTKALPGLSTNISINGPGADKLTVRRDTGGDYPVFRVTNPGTISLFGMTITNGTTGIQNFTPGTVNIEFSVISGNSDGGGIFNENVNGTSGTVNVTNSTISSNTAIGYVGVAGRGGGIFNAGIVNVLNCSLVANRAIGGGSNPDAFGGAIYNSSSGTVGVTNSTLNGNSAQGSPGGVGIGGAISTENVLNILNSTLSSNSATGGDDIGNGTFGAGGAIGNLSASGAMKLTNSTVSSNHASAAGIFSDQGHGGGIYIQNGGTVVRSAIIALNTASAEPDVFTANQAIISGGFNLVGNADGSSGFTQATDKKGSSAAPSNPQFDQGSRDNVPP